MITARGQTPGSASRGWRAPLLGRLLAPCVMVLAALAVVLASAPLLPAAPAYAAATPSPDNSMDDSTDGETAATPLTVRLQSLSPGVVRPRGPVRMRGTVRNDSEEVWRDVNVAAFVGDTPLTTREELTLAAESPEETAVGDRLDAEGSFVGIGDLDPGETADFALTVARDDLPPASAPGVYWIGAHALGASADGRDSVADGRARTFVPVLPPRGQRGSGDQAPTVPVSLVVPLRETALRAADGSLADPEAWSELVGPDGRLGRISRFVGSAGDRPVSWLVDPAVLDAVADLGQGNPSLSLGPRERASDDDEEGEDPSPSASGSPDGSSGASPSPSASTSAEPDIPDDGVPSAIQAASARALLDRLGVQLGDAATLLATPYADADAMALLRHDDALADQAVAQTRAALARRSLSGETVVATPSGRVDPALVDGLPDDVGLLVSDQGDLDLPVSGVVDGRRVLLGDSRTSSGGPAPTAAQDPLAVRQRILAETSLESTAAAASGTTPRPVVVVLPRTWDPGADWADADFFSATDVPWMRWAATPSASSEVGLTLSYPRSVAEREVDAAGVDAARALVGSAEVLDDLLANDNDVLTRMTGAALASVSYGARARPALARASAEALRRSVEDDLAQVSVRGTDFVTLSSGEGTLTVTVVNDLDRPVTVGVEVRADAEVETDELAPLELGPEQRGTVRLPVRSETGVHDVTLVPVTAGGQPAGVPFEFVLRTSQVGRAVWFVMGGAGVLFLVTLLRRVRQRLREGRGLRTRAARAASEARAADPPTLEDAP